VLGAKDFCVRVVVKKSEVLAHATNMGNRDCSRRPTTVRSDGGHDSGGPSGDADQWSSQK
jgi:hypothetical protein